jgi:hypothetical protein
MNRPELEHLLATRLVQTNVAGRATALLLGLAHIAQRVDEPVTLLEIGASAGLLLRFDRYRYEVGGRTFGARDSTVTVQTAWRAGAPPDLDRVPVVDERLGLDLDPVDARSPEQRAWLRALVWPENTAQAERLQRALDIVAADPPRLIAGDAVEHLPALEPELPSDRPLVVFHAATRAHVPAGRRGRFDRRIAELGRRRRLLHLSLEASRRLRDEFGRGGSCALLELSEGEGPPEALAIVDGHGAWIEPVDRAQAREPRHVATA